MIEVEFVIQTNKMIGAGYCMLNLLIKLGLKSAKSRDFFDELETYARYRCKAKYEHGS